MIIFVDSDMNYVCFVWYSILLVLANLLRGLYTAAIRRKLQLISSLMNNQSSAIGSFATDTSEFAYDLLVMSDSDDNLAELLSLANELKAFFGGLEAIQYVRDDRDNLMLGDELGCIDEILVRAHGRACTTSPTKY